MAELAFEKVVGTLTGILVPRTLKAEQCEEHLGNQVWDESRIAGVPREIFERAMLYMLDSPDLDKNRFLSWILSLHEPKIKETAITLAPQFRQDGRVLTLQENLIEVLSVKLESAPEELKSAINALGDEPQ